MANSAIQLIVFAVAFSCISSFFIYKSIVTQSIWLTSNILLAVALYIVSNLFRALRLRITVACNAFSYRDAVFVHYTSSVLGNITVPFAKEIAAVYLFNTRIKNNLARILISIIYIRFFDFLVITPVFLFLSFYLPVEARILVTIFTTLLITSLFVLLLIPRLCDLFISHLLKYRHTKRTVWVVKNLARFKTVYSEMKLNRIEVMFLILILTMVSWIMEFFSVILVLRELQQKAIMDAFNVIINNISTNIPFFSQYSELNNLTYSPLYIGLILFSILILLRAIMRTIMRAK